MGKNLCSGGFGFVKSLAVFGDTSYLPECLKAGIECGYVRLEFSGGICLDLSPASTVGLVQELRETLGKLQDVQDAAERHKPKREEKAKPEHEYHPRFRYGGMIDLAELVA